MSHGENFEIPDIETREFLQKAHTTAEQAYDLYHQAPVLWMPQNEKALSAFVSDFANLLLQATNNYDAVSSEKMISLILESFYSGIHGGFSEQSRSMINERLAAKLVGHLKNAPMNKEVKAVHSDAIALSKMLRSNFEGAMSGFH